MSLEKPAFFVSPLFYDALSQEFTPSTDLRRHTLGRLAGATVLKGGLKLIEDGTQEGRYAEYTYSPSWAPGRICQVEADFVGKNDVVMHSLRLDNRGSFNNLIITGPQGEYGDAMSIAQAGRTTLYQLELGDRLTTAREAVAIAAETFFADKVE